MRWKPEDINKYNKKRNMNRRLSSYFRTYRKRAGLSQVELSKLLCLKDSSSVCRIERGSKQPTLDQLIAYQLIFDINPSKIIPERYSKVAQKIQKAATCLKSTDDPDCPLTKATRLEFYSKILQRLPANLRKHDGKRQGV